MIRDLNIAVFSDIHKENINKRWDYVDEILRLGIAKAYVTNDFLAKEEISYINPTKGTYILFMILSRTVYIGSTNNFYERRNSHILLLKNNKHKNKNLQKVYNDDLNKDNKIIFIPLPTKTISDALELEQKLLDCYKDNPRLLNICTNAKIAQLGQKHSEETKNKLKAAMAIRIVNPNHGANISKHAIKRFSNIIERENQSNRIKLAWQNPITREKLLAANKAKGKPVIINDKHYPSIIEASKQLGIVPQYVLRRLRSSLYPSWRYFD